MVQDGPPRPATPRTGPDPAWFPGVLSRRVGSGVGYLVAGLRTAVPALASWPLIPLVLIVSFGVPVLPRAVGLLRHLTSLERKRAARILGEPIGSPYPVVLAFLEA